MSSVEIQQWVARSQALLTRARSMIELAPSDRVRAFLSRVPLSILPENGPVRVVFAGQYSAGKSSILRAMTGREDIAVGAGITTHITYEYDWNGIAVIDTPGVHTNLRPDHDAVAYDAIAGADLLVFVATNELFDSHLATHFRKLTIERDKAHEMLLVINKMGRCAGGNVPWAQDVIREDLRKIMIPFTPEQLRTSFVDAESALESEAEADTKVSNVLMKRSGFTLFLEALNDFVREKGLAGRYTTVLYNIEQVLLEALAAESTGDTDVDALKELLLQQRRALVETQARIPRSVEGCVQETAANVRRDGRELADLIHGKSDPKEIECGLQAAQERVQTRTDDLASLVRNSLEQEMISLGERIEQIGEGELARELLPRLAARLEVELAEFDANSDAIEMARKTANVARKLGEFLVENSFNPATKTFAGLFKLNQYSGTATHSAVKSVGHFFGKSFKPWEAVKWTRVFTNAGRVFVVAGAVVNVVLQIKEDAGRAKLEAELRESRSAVRVGFGEAAQAIEMHFDEITRAYVTETIGHRLAEVDQQLSDLDEMQQSRESLFQNLQQLLSETRALIREMHTNRSDAA